MRKFIRKISLACVLVLSVTNQVDAVPIGPGDFSGSETLIDFNSLVSGTPITNQYAGLGVTFSGSPFQADPLPGTTIDGTMSAANHSPINNPISAFFSSAQNRVGMVFGTPQGSVVSSVEIQAFLGVALVDSATFVSGGTLPGGNVPTVFGGLDVAGGFDRIEFSNLSGNQAFQIDDFRFEVPEPATALLLAAGLASVALRRRLSA